jgi:hypothetical protein
MKSKAKSMYTGHHEIVDGGDCRVSDQKPAIDPKNKRMKMHLKIYKAIPTSVTTHLQGRFSSSIYSRWTSFCEGAVMTGTSMVHCASVDDFSALDGYSLMKTLTSMSRAALLRKVFMG